MKPRELIWVLVLAGAVIGCNTGEPIQGCTVDPITGACVGSGNGNGNGGGGTGGTGPTACDPGDADFTNACTCSSLGEENIYCDYGCTALGNLFGFSAVLNVYPDEAFTGGGTSTVEFDGFFVVSEAFIAGAEEVVGNLNKAVVGANATLPVVALTGAEGPELILTLPAGFELDLNSDPDNNGVPGPFPLPFEPGSQTYTFGASGSEACFNLAAGVGFQLTITDPFVLPAPFTCQPADQELVNQNNVECTSNEECLAPSTCDAEGACTVVIEPEPTAGQVCLTIP